MNFEINSQRTENIVFRTRTELELKWVQPN